MYSPRAYSDLRMSLNLAVGSQVKNTVKGKMERVGRMLQMHANERTEVKEARAGDIIALVGLKDTITGELSCPKFTISNKLALLNHLNELT